MTVAFPLQRLRLNFLRRYKWAFRPSYDAIDSDVVAPPEFFKFISARQELLAVRVYFSRSGHQSNWHDQDEGFSPSDSFKLARYLLQQLSTSPTGWAGHWSANRMQVNDPPIVFVSPILTYCSSCATSLIFVKIFMLCRQACEICKNLTFPLSSGSRRRIPGFRQ